MTMSEKLARLHPVFIFLVMEFLAITAFGLGGNNLIFYVLGFALAIFGGILTFKRFEKDELFSLLIMGIPVILIAIFVAFGTFSFGNSVLVNIAAFLGIISFFALGLFFRRSNNVNAEILLLCIGGGLALLVLISTIYTSFAYGPFYSLRFKDTPNYFYNGVTFDITKEQGWLNGFSFVEISLQYGGLFGVLLSTGLAGMMFVNPKKNLVKFILTGVFGLVGLFSLLVTPNVMGLLMLVPMLLVAAIVRVLNLEVIPQKAKDITRRVISISFIAIVALIIIFFVLAFLNANGYNQATGYDTRYAPTSAFAEFIKNNAFLNKVFNNGRIMQPINKVLNQSAILANFFGFINNDSYFYLAQAINTNTGVFEVEIIKEGGIFAFIVLFFFLIFFVQNVFRYGKDTKDSLLSKGIIVSGLFIFLLYCSLNYDAFPYIHASGNYVSLFRSLPGLIFLFFAGFTFYPDLKKGTVPVFEREIEIKENVEVSKENANEDDYSFSMDESEENVDEK